MIFLTLLSLNIFVATTPSFKLFLSEKLGNLGGLYQNISLAYIGSYVFYCFQILLPEIIASLKEKKYIRNFFDGRFIEEFGTVFKSYYEVSTKKLSKQDFLLCERIPRSEYYVAETINMDATNNRIHYVSISDKQTFSKSISHTITAIQKQVKNFKASHEEVLSNEDLIFKLGRIEKNAEKLSNFYRQEVKDTPMDNVLYGDIGVLMNEFYNDISYVKNHYKTTSAQQTKVLKTENEYAAAKRVYEAQIAKTFGDITNLEVSKKSTCIKINSREPILLPISTFFKNRGYKIKTCHEKRMFRVEQGKRKYFKVIVFGKINLGMSSLIILKKNFTEKDLYWLENEVVDKNIRV